MLVYMCACRLRLCVRSALDSASLIILVDPHPTTMPCRWRMPPVALVISRAGAGCSGERRPHSRRVRLAGPGPTGLAGPRLWGGGPLGLRARARSALGWSAAGGACGLAATAPWGAYTVAVGGPAFGLSSALFWVEAAVVPAVVLLGVPCPGGLWMFEARVFSVPASCLADGLLFPTHTIKHLHGGTL